MTAKHCIKDALAELGQKVLDGERPPLCKGANAKGFRTKIHTSLPGSPLVDAVMLYPDGNKKSDMTVMAIPCTTRLKRFPLIQNQAPTSVTTYLPMTRTLNGTPVTHTRQKELVIGSKDGFPITAATNSPQSGSFEFLSGQRPNPGDSGSPSFIQDPKDGKWYLAGVLTGYTNGSNAALVSSGLGLDGNGKDATANLDRDAKKMLENVKCDSPEPSTTTEPEGAGEVAQPRTAGLDLDISGSSKKSEFPAPKEGDETVASYMKVHSAEYPEGTQLFHGPTLLNKVTLASASKGVKLDPANVRIADLDTTQASCIGGEFCQAKAPGRGWVYFVKPAKTKPAEQETAQQPPAQQPAQQPPATPAALPDPENLAQFQALVAASPKPVFLVVTNSVGCSRCAEPTYKKNLENYMRQYADQMRFVVIDMHEVGKKPGYNELHNAFASDGWPKAVYFKNGTARHYAPVAAFSNQMTLPKLVSPTGR